jgi:hypothetical protein
MSMLGHAPAEVNVLKIDIEGFEWKVFPEILASESPPIQILFELHNQFPAVAGPYQTAALFLGLFERGYRVTSLEINPRAQFCAEISVLRVTEYEVL